MNSYEAKQEARRERLERRAAALAAGSEQRFRAARSALDGIEPGQPILVGHHSEKRHRRALERHDQRMRKAIELQQEAKELAARAAAVGTGGISSDDPDAPAKLREKLEELEQQRERRKAINAAWRKAKGPEGLRTLEPPLTEKERERIASNLRYGDGKPWPSYSLTNLGARIRDTRAKLEAAEAREARRDEAPTTEQRGGATITADPADNRVTITWGRRLEKVEYQQVRSFGFLWSPTRNGFTRKLSGGALAVAQLLADRIP